MTEAKDGEHPAEILDTAGEVVAAGLARLVPDTNFGTFVPDGAPTPALDALILGPQPAALRLKHGPVYRINSLKIGDGKLVERYYVFRQYGTVGS